MQEVQPISYLSQLNFRFVLNIKNDGMDTVGVANEVVVKHVVIVVAGKLPHRKVSTTASVTTRRPKTYCKGIWETISKGHIRKLCLIPMKFALICQP